MFNHLKLSFRQLFIIFLILLQISLSCSPVLANPYFYLAGNSYINVDTEQEYELRVNTDGYNIGALQTILTFNPNYFTHTQASILTENTICDIFTYPNPGTTGVENKVTPYITNGNSLVVTCGIMGSGYNGSNGLIAKLKFTSAATTNASEFAFSQSYFSYLGSPITPGAMSSYFVTIVQEGSPTPTPTPNPAATLSATPAPTITTVLDDVTFIDVSQQFSDINEFANAVSSIQRIDGVSFAGSDDEGGFSLTDDAIEFVDIDDTIPAPPADIEMRPPATPYQIPEMELQEGQSIGQVMSVQNLRDLLLPGKTQADKTVVMINLISTIIFLIILAFVIAKMFLNRRQSQVKSKYINELITGELSVLETKIDIVKEQKGKEKFEAEFRETVENILNNVSQKPDEPEKKEKNK